MIPGSKGLNPHELAHRWNFMVGSLLLRLDLLPSRFIGSEGS